MLADGCRSCSAPGDGGERAAPSFERPDAGRLDHAQRVAAEELESLVSELEPTLDPYQRRLLHQIRLAAESLGAIRVASLVRGGR